MKLKGVNLVPLAESKRLTTTGKLLPGIVLPPLVTSDMLLEKWFRKVCKDRGISFWTARSASRKREAVKVRALFAHKASRKGHSQEAIGRVIGRERSSVSELINKTYYQYFPNAKD